MGGKDQLEGEKEGLRMERTNQRAALPSTFLFSFADVSNIRIDICSAKRAASDDDDNYDDDDDDDDASV